MTFLFSSLNSTGLPSASVPASFAACLAFPAASESFLNSLKIFLTAEVLMVSRLLFCLIISRLTFNG